MEEKRKKDRGAFASLVLGLLFWFPLLNFIFGAFAVYLGLESLKRGKGQRNRSIKAAATAGILLGLIPFYLGLMALLKRLLGLDDVLVVETGLFIAVALVAILLIMLKAKRLI